MNTVLYAEPPVSVLNSRAQSVELTIPASLWSKQPANRAQHGASERQGNERINAGGSPACERNLAKEVCPRNKTLKFGPLFSFLVAFLVACITFHFGMQWHAKQHGMVLCSSIAVCSPRICHSVLHRQQKYGEAVQHLWAALQTAGRAVQ